MSRFCSSAPTPAVPITVPTCRVVLKTPEAAPAIIGLTLRMATVVIGAKVQPMPMPATNCGARKSYQAELAWAIERNGAHPAGEQEQPGHQDVLAADPVGHPPGDRRHEHRDHATLAPSSGPALRAEKP